MPYELRTIKAGDGAILKSVTLRSVEDAPYAFGGAETLEEERERPDAQWEELAAECGGEVEAWRDRCVGAYFFMEGGCGGREGRSRFSPARWRGQAHMTGVWVDPRYRRRGLGRQMVEEARVWAASKGAGKIMLWVDDTNPEGARFYESLGFLRTGENRPISTTSSDRKSAFVLELPMQRSISEIFRESRGAALDAVNPPADRRYRSPPSDASPFALLQRVHRIAQGFCDGGYGELNAAPLLFDLDSVADAIKYNDSDFRRSAFPEFWFFGGKRRPRKNCFLDLRAGPPWRGS